MMTARVLMLKSRVSLTCFQACFLPGRAKDLSAPWVLQCALRFPVFVDHDQRILVGFQML